jgi:hypothetical protein
MVEDRCHDLPAAPPDIIGGSRRSGDNLDRAGAAGHLADRRPTDEVPRSSSGVIGPGPVDHRGPAQRLMQHAVVTGQEPLHAPSQRERPILQGPSHDLVVGELRPLVEYQVGDVRVAEHFRQLVESGTDVLVAERRISQLSDQRACALAESVVDLHVSEPFQPGAATIRRYYTLSRSFPSF